MAVITTVMSSDVISENRFSAEYFNPKYVFSKNPMSEWERIGKILKRYQYGISIAMNENGTGYPIFRMNEISNCFAIKAEKYADITHKEFLKFRLMENDILFNRTNSFEFVGRTGIVKEQTDSIFASYLIRIVPDTNKILPEYLTIYLNTEFGIGQIKRRAMPSINQSNVSASELRRILVLVPHQDEQKQIAKSVNDAYELNRQAIAQYLEATQLLESELGLDKLVIDKPLSYEASFSEVISNNRTDADYFQPKYRKIREIVKNYKHGWDYILSLTSALSPNIDPKKTPGEQFSYVELADIDASLGRIISKQIVTGASAPSRARRLVKTGDIIASAVVGSVDKAALVDETSNEHLASTGFFHFRPLTVSSEYLLIMVKSLLVTTQLQQESTGGILSAVPDHRLKYVIVPRIPEAIQRQISVLVKNSHTAKRESENLLKEAKKRVEDLIEEATHYESVN